MPAVWPNRKTSGSQKLFEASDAMHWKQLCSHWRRGLAPNGAKGAQEPKRRQTEGKFQTGAKQNLDSAFPVETWPGAKRLALAPKAPNAPNDCAKRAKAPNRRQTEGRRQTGAKQPWARGKRGDGAIENIVVESTRKQRVMFELYVSSFLWSLLCNQRTGVLC